MDKEKAKEKIRLFFGSNDPGLWKLGRIMCHQLRISYWIETENDRSRTKNNVGPMRWIMYQRKVKRYSLEEIPEVQSRGWTKCVYEIKLDV